MNKVFVCAVLIASVTAATGARAAAGIVITEIMYDVPGSDTGQEWIEIFNPGPKPVEIPTGTSGWRLFDDSAHTLKLIQGSAVLDPQHAAVIADNAATWLSENPSFAGTVFDSVLSLKNASGTVGIAEGSGGPLFTSVSYDAVWGGAGNGMSLERGSLDAVSVWFESSISGGTPGLWNPTATSTSTTTPQDTPTDTPTTTPSDPAVSETPTTTPNEPPIGANRIVIQEPPPVFSHDIHINELLPNPAGADSPAEWIELYNAGNAPVNLAGWKLQDSSSTVYTISEEDFAAVDLSPGAYFVISRDTSGIALNNTGGDSVKLYWPDTSLADVAVYLDSAPEGESWARFETGWEWAIPTRGGENRLSSSPVGPVSGDDEVASAFVHLTIPNTLKNGDLVISEFLPNPEGDDSSEFIELKNTTTSTIDLAGWELDDASGGSAPYRFPQGAIAAGAYMVVLKEQSRLSLNNTADSVRILDPSGRVWQEIEYEDAPEAHSYAFDEDAKVWFWSAVPSLLGPAVHIVEAAETATSTEPLFVTVGETADLLAGTEVLVSGVVVLPPGAVSQRKWYLADESKASGEGHALEVYQARGTVPRLTFGQRITVRAEVGMQSGNPQLRVKDDRQIQIGSMTNMRPAAVYALSDVDQDVGRSYITVEGELTRINMKSFTLSDENGKVLVRPVSPLGIDDWKFEKNQKLRATGFLLFGSGSPTLYVLRKDDIVAVENPEVQGYATSSNKFASSSAIDVPLSHENDIRWLYLATIPVAFGIGWVFKRYIMPRIG